MKIDKVTITGADNLVDPIDLIELSFKYPFVEWGILFSESKGGTNRYPTQDWINSLNKFDLNLSAHFCGWHAREVLENDNIELIEKLHRNFKRVQLNYNFKDFSKNKKSPLRKLYLYLDNYHDRRIILQVNKDNKNFIEYIIVNHDKLNSNQIKNINFLYDSSGGLGKEIEVLLPPFINFYTGYAGGISLINVDTILNHILESRNDKSIWIDLESGARTNDKFDLEKVEEILKKVKHAIL